MKIISLNTHSWLEKNPLEKLKQTADFILKQDADIITLQEVNQTMTAEIAVLDTYFSELETKTAVKADNYALLLIDYLREKGANYYWSWTCSHIGYDVYDEGSAILSKYPFRAEELLVSPMDDVTDYHTRKLLMAHFEAELTVFSCHFSWWSDKQSEGFYYEWQQLLERVTSIKHQVALFGDFNAPAHLKNEGYDLVQEHFIDVFELAEDKKGSYTVDENIDGWQDNTEKLRIDFGFILQEEKIKSYEVVFNELNGPIVSDHFGIMVVTDNK